MSITNRFWAITSRTRLQAQHTQIACVIFSIVCDLDVIISETERNVAKVSRFWYLSKHFVHTFQISPEKSPHQVSCGHHRGEFLISWLNKTWNTYSLMQWKIFLNHLRVLKILSIIKSAVYTYESFFEKLKKLLNNSGFCKFSPDENML